MEKKFSDSKRKSIVKTDGEPQEKKIRQSTSIEDILPPSEERNKNLSRSSSKVNIEQNDNNNEEGTSDTKISFDKLSNSSSVKDDLKDTQASFNKSTSADKLTTLPTPSASLSIEEIIRSQSSNAIINDTTIIIELPNNDDTDKEEKSKESRESKENQSSDHGTNLGDTKTSITTVDGTDDPQTSKNSTTTSRNKCAYGQKCYRKSSEHKAKYSHPGDPDYIVDNKPVCRYGMKCYRKDPKHKQEFKHVVVRRKRAQTPVRSKTLQSHKSDSENSSAEESVDESEYNPSGLDNSSDDDDDDSDW